MSRPSFDLLRLVFNMRSKNCLKAPNVSSDSPKKKNNPDHQSLGYW